MNIRFSNSVLHKRKAIALSMGGARVEFKESTEKISAGRSVFTRGVDVVPSAEDCAGKGRG